jgi:acyl-CoA thioester hydrolase
VTNSALESVVCNGKMGVVFFDFDKHQITDVPHAFKALLGRQESQVA